MHRLRVRLLLREWLSWGAGKGLLLMPTVFGTLISYVEPPWPYALVYPARGIADLLGPVARAPGGEALSRLVGPRRADVLRALDAPAPAGPSATSTRRWARPWRTAERHRLNNTPTRAADCGPEAIA
jgi:hypothetical protein